MTDGARLEMCIATEENDLVAAKRLRYRVFVEEFGAVGDGIDHEQQIEADSLDPWFDHLVLIDRNRDESAQEHVVGVYRLLRGEVAMRECGFYSSSEYDLSALIDSGRTLVELGRSCVHRDYRASSAMFQLWRGLASYVLDNEIEIMFGVASFHGTDIAALAEPLAYLHRHHLAPEDMRVRARREHYVSLDRLRDEDVDRRRAMDSIPSLIKAYLRLGGFVGDGAFIDHEFNTIDVCLVMDTERMSSRHRNYYVQHWGRQ